MKSKVILTSVTSVFVMVMLIGAMGASAESAVAGSNYADPDRYLITSATMYFEWDYNETLADESGFFVVQTKTISRMIGLVTAEDNETSAFSSSPGYDDTADISDLNITTTGQKFSSDLSGDIESPTDETLNIAANGQKVAAIDEDALADFDNDAEMQFNIFESIALDEYEDEVADDLVSGWNDTYIDLKKAEIVFTFDWTLMKALLDDMMAHARWDQIDSMDTEDLQIILEDVLPSYTLGFNFAIANNTYLDSTTADLTPTEEVVNTVSNKTDATLAGFTQSFHLTNGIVGYMLENYEALTAAVNMRHFGLVQSARDFGSITGLTVSDNDTVSVAVQDEAIDGAGETVLDRGDNTTVSFWDGAIITIGEFLDKVAWAATAAITGGYWWASIILAFVAFVIILLVVFNGKVKNVMKWVKAGWFRALIMYALTLMIGRFLVLGYIIN